MIATKKAKLIKKHLGSNTPEWVVKNCMELLKEYEEIEWCGVPESHFMLLDEEGCTPCVKTKERWSVKKHF